MFSEGVGRGEEEGIMKLPCPPKVSITWRRKRALIRILTVSVLQP